MSRKKTKTPAAPIVRCGIYTRKSTEEGLEQEFNSLDAQRESGEACVKSQRHEGWVCKRRKGDSDSMAAFRARMRTEESKAILKQRPSIAEFPNAECRNRGLQQFRVRGLQKVRTSTLWYAITFNFMRMLHLGVL